MEGVRASHFLNVDLDVRSRADLSLLVARMERSAVVLRSETHRGVHFATFEVLSHRTRTRDRCIAGLARLIEDLHAAERSLWEGASERTFDIGIQAGADAQVYKPTIKPCTLERVAALGAAIALTIYPYGWDRPGARPCDSPGGDFQPGAVTRQRQVR